MIVFSPCQFTGLPFPVCVVQCASPKAVSVSQTSLTEGDI